MTARPAHPFARKLGTVIIWCLAFTVGAFGPVALTVAALVLGIVALVNREERLEWQWVAFPAIFGVVFLGYAIAWEGRIIF